MTPTRFVLIGVGLFLVMTIFAFFARDEAVETDLHNRIQLAMLQEPDVAIDVDHLDAELTGHVTSATHREELQSRVGQIYGIGRVSNSKMTVVPNPPVRSLPVESEPFTPAAPVEDLPDPTLQPEPIDQLPDQMEKPTIGPGNEGDAEELRTDVGDTASNRVVTSTPARNIPPKISEAGVQPPLTTLSSGDSSSAQVTETNTAVETSVSSLPKASQPKLGEQTSAVVTALSNKAYLPAPQLPVPLNSNREPELASPISHAN